MAFKKLKASKLKPKIKKKPFVSASRMEITARKKLRTKLKVPNLSKRLNP